MDTRELAKRVAPCTIHTLDAFFNARVITLLHRVWRFRDVVAIHDAWFVPEFVDAMATGDDDSRVERIARALDVSLAEVESITFDGKAALTAAIDRMGELWLRGISGVYDWFVTALTGSRYEDLATAARARWHQRATERRWPKFTAS